MGKIADKLKRAISFRSTRSSSSRASTDMEVDPPSPAVGAPSRSAPVESNVLLQEKQLNLQGDREKNIYKKLEHSPFVDAFCTLGHVDAFCTLGHVVDHGCDTPVESFVVYSPFVEQVERGCEGRQALFLIFLSNVPYA